MKKIVSIFIVLLGAVSFISGNYMAEKASRGEEQITEAEQNAEGRREPVIGPIRKGIHAEAQERSQEKIQQGTVRVASSEVTAKWLHGIGIALFGIGLIAFVLSIFQKKKG